METKVDIQIEALDIIAKVQQEQYSEINKVLEGKLPYDLATIFQSIPEKHSSSLLHHLEIPTIASMMQKLNEIQQLEVLGKIGPNKANRVLALLDTVILTRLLRRYPEAKIQDYLAQLEPEKGNFLKKIIHYPNDTAGRLMTNRYISICESSTVVEALERIREDALYSEKVDHLFLVDDEDRFTGIVSYRDLIIATTTEVLKNLKLKQVMTVSALTKKNKISQLLQRYDFMALPVVDEDGTLLGVISFDDMIEVLVDEASDDYGKFSTASKEIDFKTKPITAAFRRLPWLIALLCIGFVSGSIISTFESTLESVVALAFFMPLIAGMTGNTGTQSLAVVVRGLAENELNIKTALKLIVREGWVGLIIGVICGLLIFLIASIWQSNVYLGVVVGGSLFLTLILGTLAGTIIPLLLYKLKMDPAVASGPLITTINDIFSLFTYFTIASWLIHKLV